MDADERARCAITPGCWFVGDASGAPQGWIEGLVRETRLPIALAPERLADWQRGLHSVRYRFILSIVDASPRPSSREWKALLAAAEKMQAALRPFAPYGVRHDTSDRVFRGGLSASTLKMDLRDLQHAARAAIESGRQGGRPDNVAADHACGALLRLYRTGFGREPSRNPTGPTVRFVRAFFASAEGDYQYDERVNWWIDDRPRMAPNLIITHRLIPPQRIQPQTIPDLIRHAIEAENRDASHDRWERKWDCDRRIIRKGEEPDLPPWGYPYEEEPSVPSAGYSFATDDPA